MNRTNISSGAKWENLVGYSRAVKVGNVIEVAGTTAMKDSKLVGKGDAYAQTIQCLTIIENALAEAGVTMDNVVRTRLFVTNIDDWEAVGKAHCVFFKNIKPATTMVEVSSLIDPDMLVEIEATAIID